MFWNKLVLINLVVLYIAFKLFGLITWQLKKNEALRNTRPGNQHLSKKILCNSTDIFKSNEKISNKFDELRVRLIY